MREPTGYRDKGGEMICEGDVCKLPVGILAAGRAREEMFCNVEPLIGDPVFIEPNAVVAFPMDRWAHRTEVVGNIHDAEEILREFSK